MTQKHQTSLCRREPCCNSTWWDLFVWSQDGMVHRDWFEVRWVGILHGSVLEACPRPRGQLEDEQVQMYYGSGTGGRCSSCAGQMAASDGSTFLHETMSWPPSWKYDINENPTPSTKNNPAIFHLDLIWGTECQAFSKMLATTPQQEEEEQDK